ncbi:MAG: polysaccharide biosynthesis protein PslJ [Actinomycetota bacterium]|jgi:hypothetical protein
MAIAAAPILLAASLASAGIVGALAVPSVFLAYRVGPTSANVSISDAALLCAIPVAMLNLRSVERPLSSMIRLVSVYELVLLGVVATHPSSVAITEWAHRFVLMVGGLVVGAAIVRLGSVRFALRAFLVVAGVYALAAVIWTVTHGLAPAYPLNTHKNASGGLFAMAIALIATMPLDDVVPHRAYRPLYLLYGAALLATRSRGAMIGAAIVLGAFVFSQRSAKRLRVIVALSAVAGLVFVWTSVRDERRTDIGKTGSLSLRDDQQAQASDVFRAHRLTGAGIRYYDENPELAKAGRPSSTAYEVTAESGVVGAADLLFLVSGVFVIFRRVRAPYAATAMAVFGVKVVHAVFDIFWVAGPFTLPWLILGMAAVIEYTDEDDDVTDRQATSADLTPAQR